MSALALSLFLVAGFVLIRRWQVSRILSLKEGQVVYFASIIPAVFLFFLSAEVFGGLEGFSPVRGAFEELGAIFDSVFPEAAASDRRPVLLGVFSILVAVVVSSLANIPIDNNAKLTRFMYEEFGEGEPLDSVLSDAVESELPILVTTASGKFYVGYSLVSELYGVSGSQWLHLAPWLSGYRDAQKKLEFTTAYAPVARRNAGEKPLHDPRFQIALPLAAVISVTPFDFELYARQFSGDESSYATTGTMHEIVKPPGWKPAARLDFHFYWVGLLLVFLPPLLMSGPWALQFLLVFSGASLLAISACQPGDSQV